MAQQVDEKTSFHMEGRNPNMKNVSVSISRTGKMDYYIVNVISGGGLVNVSLKIKLYNFLSALKIFNMFKGEVSDLLVEFDFSKWGE